MTEPELDNPKQLVASYFAEDTESVARNLLGALLLRRINEQWIGGRIVETEAYLHEHDLASHSARGKGNSNAAMFAEPGTIYVYPIHAKVCFNVVTQPENVGAAVLVRALEPIWGIDVMETHRGLTTPTRLTSGPAMLCQALAIDRSFNGRHFTDEPRLMLCQNHVSTEFDIVASPRIGISKSVDLPLRFFIKDNRFVSRRK
ncbi:DNA-3-methyladenine glycosylase [Rubripirellula reticaptiva]|uniref:Putative 3-methyladenine DNA glycosylase n=1 Tax=Rubripirellula reticaptiva TaxID=2528013 RepID=A0A5C6FC82_9BACT|nr:DNA-3-methyladenine glycosylase [Rubripirellula reticaptiva]TWU57239.1 3-methyladenine DNA glycosylase [Rubripirellula reticaptiva]